MSISLGNLKDFDEAILTLYVFCNSKYKSSIAVGFNQNLEDILPIKSIIINLHILGIAIHK